ncbi:MAG: hypothetical protein ACRBN8_29855 [Nannocystales bacterium]
MNATARFALLLTMSALLGACDSPVEEPLEEEVAQEYRKGGTAKVWHRRWEGEMTSTTGVSYDATLALNAPICVTWGANDLTAEWDYYELGFQCTSELTYLGTSVTPDGTKTYTFHDSTKSGPCIDGLVDLRETPTPGVMLHTWRYFDNTVDAQGLVKVNGTCSPPF